MLELIDEGLEQFLRKAAPLDPPDVDVSFSTPDRTWSGKVSRPTVNVFLWDVKRSADRARGGLQTVVREGVRVHQPAFPVVELRYVLTVWSPHEDDERELLSDLMVALLTTSTLPHAHLASDLHHLDEPTMLVARAGDDHIDIAKALDGRVKPALYLTVITEVDAAVNFEAGPPVDSIGIRSGRYRSDGSRIGNATADPRRRIAGVVVDAAERGAIGAVVSIKRETATNAEFEIAGDSAEVNGAGQFLIRAATDDVVVLHVEPALEATVPAQGGIRFA